MRNRSPQKSVLVVFSAPEVNTRIQMIEARMLITMIHAPCFARGAPKRTAITIPSANPSGGIEKATMYASAMSLLEPAGHAFDAPPFLDG